MARTRCFFGQPLRRRFSSPAKRTAPPTRATSCTAEFRDYMRQERSRGRYLFKRPLEKRRRQNIRLHGTKCPECGTVQFPITRFCTACRNSEGLLEIPLAHSGRVFTFTKENFLSGWSRAADGDGGCRSRRGGRFLCQMTDFDRKGSEDRNARGAGSSALAGRRREPPLLLEMPAAGGA